MSAQLGHVGTGAPRAVSERRRRECPKCKASPGQPCHRWGGKSPHQYKVPIKKIHTER